MEAIIELIAGIILQLISSGKYKYENHRTWAITIFWIIAGGGLAGYLAWLLWFELGGLIFRILAVGLATGFIVYVTLGHCKNWPDSWL